jgi:phosphate:Na+ symporter
MHHLSIILHMAGAIALLVFSVRMVRTGVERLAGAALRANARSAMANTPVAAAYGFGAALVMQSGTAAALLFSGLAGTGIVAGASALAGILGADLGSAAAARLLSLDISLLSPLAIALGAAAFLGSDRRNVRQTGRIVVGIGLILLSLRLMREVAGPAASGGGTAAAFAFLGGDPVTAFLVAAILSWAMHSSLAFVLLVAALSARGALGGEAALAMVLGANLGGAFIPFFLTRAAAIEIRAPIAANLALRGCAAIAALAVAVGRPGAIALLGDDAAAQALNGHVAFNAALALACLPFARGAEAMARRVLAAIAPAGPLAPLALPDGSALDPAAISAPNRALACALREALKLGETVELMLRRVFELYENADKANIQQLRGLDDKVDAMLARIKLYLARVAAGKLTDEQLRRCGELIVGCVKLEQAGDIVVRSMLPLVQKKHRFALNFSREGWSELSGLHATVLANAQMALDVLASGDRETAMHLAKEKSRLRDLERDTSARHIERLREGSPHSIETSTIHLDTVRDLKQIHSLFVALAYPVLEAEGLLRQSRLAEASASSGKARAAGIGRRKQVQGGDGKNRVAGARRRKHG